MFANQLFSVQQSRIKLRKKLFVFLPDVGVETVSVGRVYYKNFHLMTKLICKRMQSWRVVQCFYPTYGTVWFTIFPVMVHVSIELDCR